MKYVLHIIRKPVIGGAEVLTKNIINADNDSVFIHLLFHYEQGPLLRLINNKKRENLILSSQKRKIAFVVELRKIIKTYNISIVHTHQAIDAVFAIIATIGLKVKIIRSYHGFEGIYDKSTKPSLKSRMIYFLINRYVAMNIFVSKALLDYYRKRNPNQPRKRQTTIHNGINDEELVKSKPVPIRNELNIPDISMVFGMIGGFTTQGRDQLTICKAMKSFVDDIKDIHFVFIGKTNNSEIYKKCYKYCVENEIISNVHFLGERNDIGGLIKSMDIYVHSSNNDTFGLALVEAMMCKVPCIASDIPTFKEVSKSGKFVALFEKGNANDLGNKIKEMLDNLSSDSLNDYLNKTKEYAENHFSIDSHLSQIHELYSQCLKS